MKVKFLKRTLACLIISASCFVNVANAGIIYSNDFEDGIGDEFSDFTTVVEAPNGEKFIGNLPTDNSSFDNSSFLSVLTLNDLAPSSLITIDFDIYGLNSLDGTEEYDNFKFFINGDLKFTDFYGHSNGNIVGPTNGTLDPNETDYFNFEYDFYIAAAATYHYSIIYRNYSNESIEIGFEANTNSLWPDEAFGLDNIVVTSVPEPTTLAIFALGIIGLASRRLKKQP